MIDRVPSLGASAAYAKQFLRDRLIQHKRFVCEYGVDMPEVQDWHWPSPA